MINPNPMTAAVKGQTVYWERNCAPNENVIVAGTINAAWTCKEGDMSLPGAQIQGTSIDGRYFLPLCVLFQTRKELEDAMHANMACSE